MPDFICISDAAYQVLVDEPPHLFKLYLSFCRDMDFSTCVIGGNARRINEAYVLERIDTPVIKGRKHVKPTRQQGRRAIDRLILLGLIEKVGRFVFSLPMELTKESAQMRLNQFLSLQDTDFKEDKKSYQQRLNLHHLSINQLGDFNDFKGFGMNMVFDMSMNWKPSEHFADFAKMAQVDILGVDSFLYGQVLADFMLYWMGDALNDPSKKHKLKRNQAGWDRGLLMALRFAKQNPSAYSVESSGAGKNKGISFPAFTRIPKSDNLLKSFADKHFPDVSFSGMSHVQVRSRLRIEADRRLMAQKAGSKVH